MHFPEQLPYAHRDAVAPGYPSRSNLTSRAHTLSELPDLFVLPPGRHYPLDVLKTRLPEAHVHVIVLQRDDQLLLREADAEIPEELPNRRLLAVRPRVLGEEPHVDVEVVPEPCPPLPRLPPHRCLP